MLLKGYLNGRKFVKPISQETIDRAKVAPEKAVNWYN